MSELCSHHSFYYPDPGFAPRDNVVPTKEEINIFRLYQCSICHEWISLVGVEKGDISYKEIEKQGFNYAYKKIVWR
jgi:hypothetical protein